MFPHDRATFSILTRYSKALGCVPSVEGYFKAMKGVCDKYGALLILDGMLSALSHRETLLL
jgi:glutamate-1-semialdehyde aminotransferase